MQRHIGPRVSFKTALTQLYQILSYQFRLEGNRCLCQRSGRNGARGATGQRTVSTMDDPVPADWIEAPIFAGAGAGMGGTDQA